MKVADLRELD